MKPFSVIILSILLMGGTGLLRGQTATGGGQAAQQLPAPTAYAVVSQDGDSQVWERTEYEQAPDGSVVARNHDYTEIQSGLNYWSNGQWLPSKEEIDIQPGSDGASAIQGQHQSYFPGDIFQGVIKEVTPDGLQLQSRPVGLFFADDTNSVLIAILTNSVGELVSSNQIVYANAFEGADASIRYTYRKAGFEQDVIVQGQLPDPAALGLDPARTRLGMLTVFFDNNQPVVTPGAVDSADGLNDSTLTFGSLTIGSGRAFAIGDTEPSTPPVGATPAFLNWLTNSVQQSSAGETPTFKRWFQLDGHNYLMEEVPYQRVAVQLSQLPATTLRQNVISTKLYAANSFLEAIPARLLSPAVQVSKSKMTRLVRTDGNQPHGLVLDYVTVNSGGNYTFQGDTTYYVSGACYFGNITLEGGAVIKYANTNSVYPTEIGNWSAGAFISASGTLTSQTSSYRPAIFTAVDDNTVGQSIGNGYPQGNYYANPAIYLTTRSSGSFSMSNVRVNYAELGFLVGNNFTLSDSQVDQGQVMMSVNGGNGITVTCNNCLFDGVSFDSGIFAVDYGDYDEPDNYNLTNCTIDNVYYLVVGPYYSTEDHGYAVNCIFSDGISTLGIWQGSYNGFYNAGSFGSPATTSSSNPFQTVGGGSYYLANGSSFTNAGIYALNEITNKTTHPPVVYASTNFSVATTFSPQAQRDTNASPNLGYHYNPIDYLVDKMTVTNATLTLTNGVAIASYNEPGIQLQNGSAIVSTGTPLAPNWFVRYQSVQEQSVQLGGNNVAAGQSVGVSGGVSAAFQFSKFACPANGGTNLYDAATATYGNLLVQSCEFWGGQNNVTGSTNTVATLVNNLFWRSPIYASATNLSSALALTNNTIYGGAVTLSQPTNTAWYAFNNDFDTCTLTNCTLTNGYNAYLNSTGRLNPTNAYDVVQGSPLSYQSSWLGTFYQPTNSPLINMGSTTADQVGLFYFTTQTNQTFEGFSTVDIGYHYVAVNTNGIPFENQYGVYDYLGSPYTNDTSGDGISDAWEEWLGLNPQFSNFNNTSERANYTYTLADWLNGISGIRTGSINSDNEGNVLSVSQ